MAALRPFAVTGASALTAAGGLEQTCAAVRASIVRLREHAYYRTLARDPEWGEQRPLLAASVDLVPPALGGPERLHRMLIPVLDDLAGSAVMRRTDTLEGALLLALPAPDPAVERWSLGASFAADLGRRTGLSWKRTVVSESGHAGVFELLATASELLDRGEVGACVLAAVDSYLSPDRMEHLDRAYRLQSRRAVDGFFPGEGAVALLLERRGGERPAAGVVAAVGLGREPAPSGSERHSTGAGLGEALRAVVPAGGAPWVLCDLNGESYRAFEWGIARTRLGERLGPLRRLVHPATSLGDLGAATGGVLLVLALAAFRRGYAPASGATVWAASEGPLRGAARIEAGRRPAAD